MKTVTVKDLVLKFGWDMVTGDKESLKREVHTTETNRAGLELAGYFPKSMSNRVVILGEKENVFIEEEMDEVDQRRAFEFLTQ